MATAKLYVSVDGGAPQDGGIDIPSGSSIEFSFGNTTGWKQARVEFFDYPEGWATPAGWTLDADGRIYWSWNGLTPPAITMPDAGNIWGVWMPRLLVNEQLDDDQNELEGLLDDGVALCILSPSGLRDMGARETTHFTTTATQIKQWLRSYQRNLRALENPKIDLETADDTPTRIRRYAMADGKVRCIRAVVKVESADGSGAVRGEWEVKACYVRVGGTLAQAYAPVVTEVFKVGTPGAPTFALNGNTDVDLRVTGIAATDLAWSVSEFTLY